MSIRGILLRTAKPFLPRRTRLFLTRINGSALMQYFIAQRIFRINSHVPWPVHWSSSVASPQKIERATDGEAPGSMPGCYIQGLNGIRIGKNCWFGPNLSIISSNHDLNDYRKHSDAPPILIGDDCWLGAGCIILPGVNLGDHVVVAAGAVVTSSFPSNCVIGGVPARKLKDLPCYAAEEEDRQVKQAA